MLLDFLFGKTGGAVALAALAFIIIATTILHFTSPKREIETFLGPKDYVATDSTYGYDLDKVRAMFARYESRHFAAHKRFILLHDLIYPLCYSIPAALILAYLLTVVSPGGYRDFRFLALLPLFAAVFDYAENFSMYAYLSSNPNDSLGVLKFSRLMTIIKIALINTSVVLALSLAARLLYLRLWGGTHEP